MLEREKNRGKGYQNQGWARNARYAKRVSKSRKIGGNGIKIAMTRVLAMRSNLERVGHLRQHVQLILTSNERQKTSELKLQIRSKHKKC